MIKMLLYITPVNFAEQFVPFAWDFISPVFYVTNINCAVSVFSSQSINLRFTVKMQQ